MSTEKRFRDETGHRDPHILQLCIKIDSTSIHKWNLTMPPPDTSLPFVFKPRGYKSHHSYRSDQKMYEFAEEKKQ